MEIFFGCKSGEFRRFFFHAKFLTYWNPLCRSKPYFSGRILAKFRPKKQTNTDSVVRAPSIISPSIAWLILLKGIKGEKADSLPLPPKSGKKNTSPEWKTKKKIQSRKIMYQHNFIQSNLKKLCRYQKESTYIPFGRFLYKT